MRHKNPSNPQEIKGNKRLFLNKKQKTNGKFDPKAYKLLAKTGYDFTLSSQLGELSFKTTGEKMYNLNKTQKTVKTTRVCS